MMMKKPVKIKRKSIVKQEKKEPLTVPTTAQFFKDAGDDPLFSHSMSIKEKHGMSDIQTILYTVYTQKQIIEGMCGAICNAIHVIEELTEECENLKKKPNLEKKPKGKK